MTSLLESRRAVLTLFTAVLLSLAAFPGYAGPTFEQREISEVGWSVTYLGRQYDLATNTTTFSYSMAVTCTEKDLSHWVLAFAGDGVPTVTPSDPVKFGLDPTTGVYGVKWDGGQAKCTTATYTVTIHGNVCEEMTQYSVKGGTYYAVGITMGPGDPCPTPTTRYSVSGTLFGDANLTGSRQADEPLLSNVSVELLDCTGEVLATALTDGSGKYTFDSLLPGCYSVRVPATSLAQDFNESLFQYFTPTTPVALSASIVSSDVTGRDFGFAVNTRSVLDDFDAADPDGDGFTFAGTGKTIGFWKHQLTVALSGKGRAQVGVATLNNYLVAVEALYLADPFRLWAGNPFSNALTILSATSSVAVDLLKKQLLATELNEVAGLGLNGDYRALQGVLVAWCEFLVKNSASYTRDDLLAAKYICDRINNTGE